MKIIPKLLVYGAIPIWKAQMVYISPKMALSESFFKLWKDAKFRKCVQAVIINEAHCIDEWGDECCTDTPRKITKERMRWS